LKIAISYAISVMLTLSSCIKDLPHFQGWPFSFRKPMVLVAGYESNGTHNVANTGLMDGKQVIDGSQDASAN
jgi:hypothetical protein